MKLGCSLHHKQKYTRTHTYQIYESLEIRWKFFLILDGFR